MAELQREICFGVNEKVIQRLSEFFNRKAFLYAFGEMSFG
jgi:hypothetical protein